MNATLDVAAGQSTQGLKLVFNHQSAILKMTATHTDFAGKPVDVSFSATGLLADGNSIATDAPVTADANGSVTVYFTVPSTTTSLSNATLSVSCSEVGYSATLNSAKQLEAGKLYNINKEALRDFEITTADDGKTTYTVNTYKGLQAWATAFQTNSYINLTLGRDITLPAVGEGESNWTPVGDFDSPYLGSIDGGGHTISGLVIHGEEGIETGFIRYMTEGTITDLTLANVSVTGQATYAGALVGQANNTIISGCKVTGNSSVSALICAGGLVGYAIGGEISGCENHAAVTATDDSQGYAGGIVGFIQVITINSCINHSSSIVGSDGAGYMVGYALGTPTLENNKDESGSGLGEVGYW